MTAANFPAELGDELVFEGGFVNNLQDPGGATDFGITLATLSSWQGHPATIAQLKGLMPSEKAAIYRGLFWNVIQGDVLPSGTDLVVFDMGVNGGPARAVRILQGVVGAQLIDGQLGPRTLEALAAYGPAEKLIPAYTEARMVFYRSLPTFPTFGAGWTTRVLNCQDEANRLAA